MAEAKSEPKRLGLGKDLTLVIKPRTKSARFLLPELIDQLESLVKFLRSLTDEDMTFEVISMNSGSVTTVLRPTRRTRVKSDAGSRRAYAYRRLSSVTGRAAATLNAIVKEESLPKYADAYSLVSLRDFYDELEKTDHVATLFADEKRFVLDETLRDHIDASLGAERIAYTSFTGEIHVINTHGRKWSFTMYPPAGPKRILCRFGKDDFEKVMPLMRQVVTVTGIGIYRGDSPFPVSIRVEHVEPRTAAGAWSDLPSVLERHWLEASENERALLEVASA